MFYLTTHSTHFIYGYMASDIWLRTILIVRKETRCHHIGYSYRLTARVLLYAPSHWQDNTYNGLCYTSRGTLAGTRNSSMGPPHEGSIRRPNPHHERTLYLWETSRSPDSTNSWGSIPPRLRTTVLADDTYSTYSSRILFYPRGYRGYEWMNEWMFNDTPAQKPIGYWVSEQGKCIKWL